MSVFMGWGGGVQGFVGYTGFIGFLGFMGCRGSREGLWVYRVYRVQGLRASGLCSGKRVSARSLGVEAEARKKRVHSGFRV